MTQSQQPLTYAKLGVSAGKDGVHAQVKDRKTGILSKGFCQAILDPRDEEWAQVIHSDSAGTKPMLAYLDWKLNGHLEAFQKPLIDSLVMNLDDMACVGCDGEFLFSMTLSRNADVIPDAALGQMLYAFDEFARKAQEQGISVKLAGGETEDVGETVDTLMVGFCAYSQVRRANLMDTIAIEPGHSLILLNSTLDNGFGFNSGIGSNGITLARHALLNQETGKMFPNLQASQAQGRWQGPFSMQDPMPQTWLKPGEQALPMSEYLLAPCNSYASAIKHLRGKFPEALVSAFHLTGGSFSKLKRFGSEPINYHFEQLHEVPSVFQAIQHSANISDEEMHQVFNMGQRMVLVVESSQAQQCVDSVNQFYGVSNAALIAGEVTAGERSQTSNQVHVKTRSGTSLTYNS